MATPVVLGVATLAVTVVAAGVSAYAAYEAGEAQADAARYNKKLAENQSALAQQQADIEAENLKEQHRRIASLQLAEQGGMGVETETGSPLLVRADTARQMARDEYLTKYGGYVGASGFQQQAGLQSMYEKQAHRAAVTGAGVSLLSSGARAGGQYYAGRYGKAYYAQGS